MPVRVVTQSLPGTCRIHGSSLKRAERVTGSRAGATRPAGRRRRCGGRCAAEDWDARSRRAVLPRRSLRAAPGQLGTQLVRHCAAGVRDRDRVGVHECGRVEPFVVGGDLEQLQLSPCLRRPLGSSRRNHSNWYFAAARQDRGASAPGLFRCDVRWGWVRIRQCAAENLGECRGQEPRSVPAAAAPEIGTARLICHSVVGCRGTPERRRSPRCRR